MIQAAIDESGTHKQSDIVCVAVVAGTSRQWRLFTEEWNPILDELPRGKTYHALDTFFDGEGQVNEQLADILIRRMDYALAVTISKTDFQAEVDSVWRSQYATEYSMGVMACVQYLAAVYRRRQRWKEGQKILYWLEEGSGNLGAVVNILRDLRTWRADKYLIKDHKVVGKGEPLVHPPDLVSHEFATARNGDETAAMEKLKGRVAHFHITRERIAKNVAETVALRERFKYRQPGAPHPPYDGPLAL